MTIFKIGLTLLLLSGFLQAAVKEVEVTSSGFSKQEAIYNALIEAVGQVNGVDIASNTKTLFSHEEISSNIEGNSKDASLSNSSVKKDVSAFSKGAVEKYEILTSSKNNSEWSVTILATIPIYKAVGASNENRRSIAIMPFHILQNSSTVGSYSKADISNIISQAIATNITQSRKFSVVDRTYTDDMAKELNIIDSKEVPISQRVKLGQKLGADYLLVGKIKKADVQTLKSKNLSTGENSSKTTAEFIVDYGVIVVGNSVVKWQDTAKAVLPLSNSNSSIEMAVQKGAEKVAANITNSLLGNIYPIRIVKITKDEVVLNQGGNSFEKGMRLDVMKAGEKVKDPYTKESLGSTESKIAQIEITRVTAKLSYAKVVNGDISLLNSNDICRRQSDSILNENSTNNNKKWRQTDVKIGENGGVKLPFD